MIVRVATAADLEVLQGLYRRSSAHWPDEADLVAAHPEWLEPTPAQVDAGWVSVVELDGRIVGFSTVTPERELEALFVDPPAMRLGAGSALVEAAGAPLTVTANRNAVPFYRRAGFRDRGPVDTPFGESLRMELA